MQYINDSFHRLNCFDTFPILYARDKFNHHLMQNTNLTIKLTLNL